MSIPAIRDTITAAGGTPVGYSRVALLRELVTALGGTPTQHDTIGLLREAVTASGGDPNGGEGGYNDVYLLRSFITANGGTPAYYDADSLWRQAALLPFGDEFYSSTVLLLNGEGANGSFTFIDRSAANRGAGSVIGGASIDTASKVFGTGSIRFDSGLNDSIQWADHASLALTGDFTIESWVRISNLAVPMAFITQYSTTLNQRSWLFQFNGQATPKTLQFQATASGSTGATAIVSANWTPVADEWYYICIERSGNTFRLYIGQQGGTAVMVASATNAISIFNSTANLTVNGTGNFANAGAGNMVPLRFTNGLARYANDAGYPVPRATFPLAA